MEQPYVIDPDQTVAQAIEAIVSELGMSIEVSGFIRYNRGEGIERQDADFAAEVADQVGR
jgi:elongation factor Ts